MPGASVKVGPVRVGSGCCIALVVPVLAAIAIGVLLSGCGGSSSKKMRHISTEEVNIATDRQTFALASVDCIKAEREEKGGPEYVEGLIHDVYGIIEIFRKNPTATYGEKSIKTILAESAESLEGCYREYALRIRDALIYG